jgi:hypothetical protein
VRLGESAHHGADVGVQVIPDQDDRGMQLLVRGGDQAGVIGFGHAAVLGRPASSEPAHGPGDARTRAKFVLHDRDASFTQAFDAVFQAAWIRVIRSAVQAPRMNSITV